MKKNSGLKIMEIVFLFSALISVLSLAAITLYICAEGFPAMHRIGFFRFVFGMKWNPVAKTPAYGIFPMIYASLASALGAVLLGVPLGLLTATFLAEIAPGFLAKLFRPCIDLMAGIPSVVYGYFGLTVIVPGISKYLGGPGNSLLAVILLLAMMILPTLVKISEVSLRSVPRELVEGSYALGADQMETIFRVMIPAAKPGILAAVVLGMGRAAGETMAVILVCGNAVQIPRSLLDMVRPLPANIALEISYASPFHEQALFAAGVILLFFIMILNVAAGIIAGGGAGRNRR